MFILFCKKNIINTILHLKNVTKVQYVHKNIITCSGVANANIITRHLKKREYKNNIFKYNNIQERNQTSKLDIQNLTNIF